MLEQPPTCDLSHSQSFTLCPQDEEASDTTTLMMILMRVEFLSEWGRRGCGGGDGTVHTPIGLLHTHTGLSQDL